MKCDTHALDERPTLAAWMYEYSQIKCEYLDSLAQRGIDFAPAHAQESALRAAKERLRTKGARFRNGDASIAVGPLSSACSACSNDPGSKTFALSMRCNRDCYFCFNANQGDVHERETACDGWRAEWEEFTASCAQVTHVGLSGGEPLLYAEESVAFIRMVHRAYPDAHVRLYTAGDFLDEAVLAALRDAGLRELRMSIKIDILDSADSDNIIDGAIETLVRAKRFIPQVMVEMPVIPGTRTAMRRLLDRLDEAGVFGINLLEFGFPLSDWTAFRQRGFQVRNPPFVIPYNYTYPGGLPIEGSELLCLELLEYALDRGLSIGVHYCSLENKNRGQVFHQNSYVEPDAAIYAFDDDDFFYKVAKVFDGDVALVRQRLTVLGAPYTIDEQDNSLLFHPDYLPHFDEVPVVCALSYNVGELSEGGFVMRELTLEVTK